MAGVLKGHQVGTKTKRSAARIDGIKTGTKRRIRPIGGVNEWYIDGRSIFESRWQKKEQQRQPIKRLQPIRTPHHPPRSLDPISSVGVQAAGREVGSMIV